MQTPNNAPKTPGKTDQTKPAAKPEQETTGGSQQQDPKQQKQDPKGDANARKDLQTPDHIAAKENAETPPNDETMSDQPGPFLKPAGDGVGRPMDKNTMSDQGNARRNKV